MVVLKYVHRSSIVKNGRAPTYVGRVVGRRSDPVTGKRVALVGYCDGYPVTSENCDCTWRGDNGKLVGRGFGFRPTMDHVGSALHVDIVHSSGGRAHLSSTVVLPDGKIATHALNFMQGKKFSDAKRLGICI